MTRAAIGDSFAGHATVGQDGHATVGQDGHATVGQDGLELVGRRGVPPIGDPGRAAREMGAGAPPPAPCMADHVLTECCTPDLEIRAASIRGLLHRYRDQPRQDAFSVIHDATHDTTVIVVCDGVGSLPRSHEAATFVADRLGTYYLPDLDWMAAVHRVNGELQRFARARGSLAPDEDPVAAGMATTVVAVAIETRGSRRMAHVVWSDDSTGWLLAPDGAWHKLTGQLSGSDAAVHTGSVRALPAARPRLRVALTSFDAGALFVMTDGVGDPLEQSAEVRQTLAAWWSEPPDIFSFARQVGFARKSHLDDRTVVGVWADVGAGGEDGGSGAAAEVRGRRT